MGRCGQVLQSRHAAKHTTTSVALDTNNFLGRLDFRSWAQTKPTYLVAAMVGRFEIKLANLDPAAHVDPVTALMFKGVFMPNSRLCRKSSKQLPRKCIS